MKKDSDGTHVKVRCKRIACIEDSLPCLELFDAYPVTAIRVDLVEDVVCFGFIETWVRAENNTHISMNATQLNLAIPTRMSESLDKFILVELTAAIRIKNHENLRKRVRCRVACFRHWKSRYGKRRSRLQLSQAHPSDLIQHLLVHSELGHGGQGAVQEAELVALHGWMGSRWTLSTYA